jgi:putative aldouronate transport system permease protein
MAFQNFNPRLGFFHSEFVGLKWFSNLYNMPDFYFIFRNTVAIACAKIIAGLLVSVVFALLLNEVKQLAFKRSVQTIVYLPHFLSWVIIGGVFVDLLSLKGLVNQFLGLFGIAPVHFLSSNDWFQLTVVGMDVWKGFGWGAVIYLAALTSINPELYEAASIDGAGRFRRMLHITLPGIRPTIVLMSALSLGNVLNAGFEQILVIYSPIVYKTADIIDTFVYRQGLLDMQFSLATAVGLFKSVIGFSLILLSNKLAYRFANYRIF